MHSRCFLHRDIKPDNYLMGLGKRQFMVYIIDYGLAKRYRDSRTGQHIPYRDNKSLTGTARYASVNTHLGIEQSRRDDLESVGFSLMYFNRGSLPWQGLRTKTKKEKYDRIRDIKVSTSVEFLCKGFPEEFAIYLNYCHKLNFDERPDYALLKKLFKDLFVRRGFALDYVYDWIRPAAPIAEPPIPALVSADPRIFPSNSASRGKEEVKRQSPGEPNPLVFRRPEVVTRMTVVPKPAAAATAVQGYTRMGARYGYG